ncbi:MAG: methyltransferase domain-containing protein [Bryobacteraceae bacterium]
MLSLRGRLIEPELLDHASPEEARGNLVDIIRLNQRFGGHGIIRKMLAGVATPTERFTVLDIGAASGDTAKLITASYPGATVFSLDLNSVNLAGAPGPKLLGDAFRLPFRDSAFDFVFASLFLHHFTDAQVVELLCGFYRLSRRALLISDLERHIFSYWFLPATQPFLRWHPITVHDGPVSVRAAFTAEELRSLASKAGITTCHVETHRPAFRLSLVARR